MRHYTEDAPQELAQMLSAFFDTMEPTPRPKAEGVPEHVRRRLLEMEASGEVGGAHGKAVQVDSPMRLTLD